MFFSTTKINVFRVNWVPILFLFAGLSLIKLTMADQIVGGWTDQNVKDDNIKALVSRSLAKINAESNDRFQLFPVEIISAKSQIVAGVLYELRIMVGRSTCAKSEQKVELANCGENDQTARKTYLVTIWQKPWENFEQITYQPEEKGNQRKESQ